MRKTAIIYLFTILSFTGAFAQDDLGDLIKGSVADANILLEGYVGPAMRTLGSGLNQGWYNTAKPHQKFGVDLTISTSLMYVPSSDMHYLVDNNKLEKIILKEYDNQTIYPRGSTIGPTSANVPTIFGPDKNPTYELDGEPFDGPGGLDLKDAIKLANALPVPMYQVGLGLPKGFDLKVRFAPTINWKSEGLKFNLLGIGVMHDVGQYLPVVKALPVDISMFVGYTKMEVEKDLTGTVVGQNQKGSLVFNATTVQALVSKKISVLTLYGGLGYNFSNSNIAMEGTYDMDDDGTPETSNPVNLDFSSSGFRATGGLRLKFAVFTLHADYTLADYNALTAGFGISVR